MTAALTHHALPTDPARSVRNTKGPFDEGVR